MRKRNFTLSEDLDLTVNDSFRTTYAFVNPDYPVQTDFFRISELAMNMIRWHWHNELEIIIVDAGTACISTEAGEVTLQAGEGIFLTRNLLHSIHAEKNQDCSIYSLRFHPRFVFGDSEDSINKKYLEPILSHPDLYYIKLDDSTPVSVQLLDLIKEAIAWNMKRSIGYELEVKACLCHFWSTVINNISSLSLPPYQASASLFDARRIKIAIRYIEQHYWESVALEEVSSTIHLSKSECCRCFKRTLGITPFEYLLKFRIFAALQKMQKKDPDADTIAGLAIAVGFHNASYFNRVFKKYLNCTPLEFKRMVMPYNESNPNNTYVQLAPHDKQK